MLKTIGIIALSLVGFMGLIYVARMMGLFGNAPAATTVNNEAAAAAARAAALARANDANDEAARLETYATIGFGLIDRILGRSPSPVGANAPAIITGGWI